MKSAVCFSGQFRSIKYSLDNILNNIEEYQEKNINYYNNKLSSKAVANYILENIK